MKLTVLVDSNTYINKYYYGEPGLSFYIEDNGKKILFDTGYSDIFITNATSMGIDLGEISSIVLSHGHNDHCRGLKYFEDSYDISYVEVYTHPDSFTWKVDSKNGELIGLECFKEDLQDCCNLKLSKIPVNISENLVFLGEIPSIVDFEQRLAVNKMIPDEYTDLDTGIKTGINENEVMVEDFLMEDTAIVYKSLEGLFIITGCSHSGICNIIEYAKKVCNNDKILGIIGGLHLFEVDERTNKTIQYLKKQNIKMLYPCHCTSFKVKAEMNSYMDVREVGVGLELEII